MPSWLKIATWLLLASLATLGFKKPTVVSVININDLFLAASFLCLCMALFKKELSVIIPKKTYVFFGIGILSVILGTLLGFFVFHVSPLLALPEYGRLVACLVMLFELYVIGTKDASFAKKALLAIVVTQVILFASMYMPESVLSFILDSSKTRLSGFLSDPNYFASFQILNSFLFLWILFAKPLGRKVWISVLAAACFCLSVGTIIWSGSRGGVIGLAFGMLTFICFMYWKLLFKKALLATVVIIVACGLSILILPSSARHDILSRSSTIMDPSADGPLLRFAAKQGRSEIWNHAVVASLENPLGYGPNYHEIANIEGDRAPHRIAHNTILQILLSGGFVLLILTGTGFVLLTKKTVFSGRSFSEVHYVFFGLIGILSAGIFLDSLLSRWVWVAIGLVMVLGERSPESSKPS